MPSSCGPLASNGLRYRSPRRCAGRKPVCPARSRSAAWRWVRARRETVYGLLLYYNLLSGLREFSKFTYIRSSRWGATPDLNGVIHRYQAPYRMRGIGCRDSTQVLPGVPISCSFPSRLVANTRLTTSLCSSSTPQTTERQVLGIDRHGLRWPRPSSPACWLKRRSFCSCGWWPVAF